MRQLRRTSAAFQSSFPPTDPGLRAKDGPPRQDCLPAAAFRVGSGRPAVGTKFHRTFANAKAARREAIVKSLAGAISQPPEVAEPSIAAIGGFRRDFHGLPENQSVGVDTASSSCAPKISRKWVRSCPAQNKANPPNFALQNAAMSAKAWSGHGPKRTALPGRNRAGA